VFGLLKGFASTNTDCCRNEIRTKTAQAKTQSNQGTHQIINSRRSQAQTNTNLWGGFAPFLVSASSALLSGRAASALARLFPPIAPETWNDT
jgi:hypothetical protein